MAEKTYYPKERKTRKPIKEDQEATERHNRPEKTNWNMKPNQDVSPISELEPETRTRNQNQNQTQMATEISEAPKKTY